MNQSPNAHEVRGTPRIGLTLTSQEVLSTTPNLEAVLATLHRFDRTSALIQCVEWSKLASDIGPEIEKWGSHAGQLQELLKCTIPDALHDGISRILSQPDFAAPITPIGILTIIPLVARFCNQTSGRPVCDPTSRWELLAALMHVQGEPFPSTLAEQGIEQWFPYCTRQILLNRLLTVRWTYVMGRLHAMLHQPIVGRHLQAKYSMSVDSWFRERIGFPAADYMSMANVYFGATVHGAALEAAPPYLIPSVSIFHRFASQTPDELASRVCDLSQLWEAHRNLEALMVRPVLKVGDMNLVTSRELLLNKFHWGLPYLATESARAKGEAKQTQGRAEFGLIFQGYLEWLLRQLFPPGEFEIVGEYFVGRSKGKTRSKDVLLLHREIAIVFEVKATVPSKAASQQSSLDGMVDWLHEVTCQAVDAADALVQGHAFRDEAMRDRIPLPTTVFPIGVTFAQIPLRHPFGEIFERQLEKKCGSPFTPKPGIAPMQYLDIGQIEVWDELVDLPRESERLFSALRNRAYIAQNRFMQLHEFLPYRSDLQDRPGILSKLVADSERTTTSRLAELRRGFTS